MGRSVSPLPHSLVLLTLACAPAVPPPPPLPSVVGDWAFEAFLQGQPVARGSMRFARADTTYSGALQEEGQAERGMTGVRFTYPQVVFLVETPEAVTSVTGSLTHPDSLAGEWSDTRGDGGFP